MPDEKVITVVCTANICRSPMAAALLQHALKAEDEPLKSLKVVSAGVSAYSGEPASVNSVRALKSVGLDISDHRSQGLSPSLADRSFAIFGMTQSHLMMIDLQHEEHTPHVYLLRQFMPDGSGFEIPDPFGQDLAAYESTRDSMVEAIPSVVDWLKKNYPGTKDSA